MHVGLHDHGIESPIDAPPPLEEAREEGALAELGDGQLDVARGRGQQARPVPLRSAGRSSERS